MKSNTPPLLAFHNTLTGKKENFVPLKKGQVGLYVCGITPYDEPHLGHARCYVVFDVLKRVFLKSGYAVRHIQNYTDIDDKIINRANQLNKKPAELAQTYIDSFKEAMQKLNVLPADDYPRVTESIPLIVNLIQKLVERSYAYALDGDVYYKVRAFKDYGRLSKRKLDELEAGARVEVDERKKDPLDFALWKKAKPGEPFWESPWGQGRPGWHIECSAMAMDRLGEDFDIHGGGQDLIFPHHENEIAQSVGATGKGFAHMWVHNGFVTINQEKMSKSLGNFFSVKDILSQFDPMAVRYFLLNQHYRSPLNFSDADLTVSSKTWAERISGAYREAARWEKEAKDGKAPLPDDRKGKDLILQFHEALRDDLNTPAALGALNRYCSLIYQIAGDAKKASELSRPVWSELRQQLKDMFDTLGLSTPEEETGPPEILSLVEEREKARQNKDWKRSDQIRDALRSQGFTVEDTSSGPRLKKNGIN